MNAAKTTTSREPLLLTPGPLTTAPATRAAMQRDWGSRDGAFIALNRSIRDRLVALAGGEGTHVCVPLQGSGTFAVEAMLGTFVPRGGKLLIVINGAYGHRMVRMCRAMGREFATYETRCNGGRARPEVAHRQHERFRRPAGRCAHDCLRRAGGIGQ